MKAATILIVSLAIIAGFGIGFTGGRSTNPGARADGSATTVPGVATTAAAPKIARLSAAAALPALARRPGTHHSTGIQSASTTPSTQGAPTSTLQRTPQRATPVVPKSTAPVAKPKPSAPKKPAGGGGGTSGGGSSGD
jgi:hypothetical protein